MMRIAILLTILIEIISVGDTFAINATMNGRNRLFNEGNLGNGPIETDAQIAYKRQQFNTPQLSQPQPQKKKRWSLFSHNKKQSAVNDTQAMSNNMSLNQQLQPQQKRGFRSLFSRSKNQNAANDNQAISVQDNYSSQQGMDQSIEQGVNTNNSAVTASSGKKASLFSRIKNKVSRNKQEPANNSAVTASPGTKASLFSRIKNKVSRNKQESVNNNVVNAPVASEGAVNNNDIPPNSLTSQNNNQPVSRRRNIVINMSDPDLDASLQQLFDNATAVSFIELPPRLLAGREREQQKTASKWVEIADSIQNSLRAGDEFCADVELAGNHYKLHQEFLVEKEEPAAEGGEEDPVEEDGDAAKADEADPEEEKVPPEEDGDAVNDTEEEEPEPEPEEEPMDEKTDEVDSGEDVGDEKEPSSPENDGGEETVESEQPTVVKRDIDDWELLRAFVEMLNAVGAINKDKVQILMQGNVQVGTCLVCHLENTLIYELVGFPGIGMCSTCLKKLHPEQQAQNESGDNKITDIYEKAVKALGIERGSLASLMPKDKLEELMKKLSVGGLGETTSATGIPSSVSTSASNSAGQMVVGPNGTLVPLSSLAGSTAPFGYIKDASGKLQPAADLSQGLSAAQAVQSTASGVNAAGVGGALSAAQGGLPVAGAVAGASAAGVGGAGTSSTTPGGLPVAGTAAGASAAGVGGAGTSSTTPGGLPAAGASAAGVGGAGTSSTTPGGLPAADAAVGANAAGVGTSSTAPGGLPAVGTVAGANAAGTNTAGAGGAGAISAAPGVQYVLGPSGSLVPATSLTGTSAPYGYVKDATGNLTPATSLENGLAAAQQVQQSAGGTIGALSGILNASGQLIGNNQVGQSVMAAGNTLNNVNQVAAGATALAVGGATAIQNLRGMSTADQINTAGQMAGVAAEMAGQNSQIGQALNTAAGVATIGAEGIGLAQQMQGMSRTDQINTAGQIAGVAAEVAGQNSQIGQALNTAAGVAAIGTGVAGLVQSTQAVAANAQSLNNNYGSQLPQSTVPEQPGTSKWERFKSKFRRKEQPQSTVPEQPGTSKWERFKNKFRKNSSNQAASAA